MPEVEITTPIPSVPPVTPGINQLFKPKRLFLPIAMVVVVFLLIGLAFGSYQLGKSQVSVPYSTIAGWNTYSDSRFAISFRYPSDLIMKEPISDFGIYTVYFARDNEWLALNVESGKVFNSIDDFVKNRYEALLVSYQETKSIAIGNVLWFVLKGTFKGTQTVPVNQVVTLKNGVAYSLGFGSDDQNKIEENNSTLIKILSTFKFIDQNADGAFCGGIAGTPCAEGYRCQLDGSYPDAGGKCVNN